MSAKKKEYMKTLQPFLWEQKSSPVRKSQKSDQIQNHLCFLKVVNHGWLLNIWYHFTFQNHLLKTLALSKLDSHQTS